ncbi:MAG: Gfo/Idh/MocA family oxidoreductase [Caldilineaceae bacterium]|nr:Gfo/Idh/MocA family oxidoreductase [Caldilineaceae bacterium]
MNTPVKAALLGLSHPHSLSHLRALQALPEVGEILLWDEDAATLAQVAQTQPAKVVATSTNLDQILDHRDLLFALAAVRNDRGPDVFLRTLAAGKHLMAEKPIGRTAADTARVIAAAQQAGCQLSVCYQNRWLPAVAQARTLVAQGLIGPLISTEMRMITTQVKMRNPQNWLFRHAQSGGGILSWLGCHYIDLMRYITGDEVVSVMAEVATRSGEAIDVEDVAVLSLRFASGAVGSLHTGYMMALSGGGYHNKAGYDTYAGFNGQLGRITWATASSPTHLVVESTHPAWANAPWRNFTYTPGEAPGYGGASGEGFIRAFILAARGEGAPPTTGQDALQVARIVDAAYESSQSGRRVEIAPVAAA